MLITIFPELMNARGYPVDLPDPTLEAFRLETLRNHYPALYTVNAFRGNHREYSEFEAASGLISLDLERPAGKGDPLTLAEIAEVLEVFSDCGYYFYPSRSWGEKGCRGRLTIQVDPPPASPVEHRALVKHLFTLLPPDTYDPKCHDPARAFYFPTREAPDAAFVWHPGPAFSYDPVQIRPLQAYQPQEFEPPERLTCSPETFEAFAVHLRPLLEEASGNRNLLAYSLVGVLYKCGADEDFARHIFASAFADANLDEHLGWFDAGGWASTTAHVNPRSFGDEGSILCTPSTCTSLSQLLLLGAGDRDARYWKRELGFPSASSLVTESKPAPTSGRFRELRNTYPAIKGRDFTSIARAFIEAEFPEDQHPLRRWRGQWIVYTGCSWEMRPEGLLINDLKWYLEHVQIKVQKKTELGWSEDVVPAEQIIKNRSLREEILKSLEDSAQLTLPDTLEPRQDLLPVQNGLLSVSGLAAHSSTPEHFTLGAPCPWDFPDLPAPTPTLDQFLVSCGFDELHQAAWVEALGYLLFGTTQHQKKIVVLQGAPNAGKGVTQRLICDDILGLANVAVVDWQALGSHFGLENVIGKRLMVDPDAIFTLSPAANARLLRIAAGDPLVVHRKYGQDYNGQVGKLMLCANDANMHVPNGAMKTRLLALRFQVEHEENRDQDLNAKLRAEVPAIVRRVWEQWRTSEARARAKFIALEDSKELVSEMVNAANPVQAFLAERCVVDPAQVGQAKGDITRAFQLWCEDVNIPLNQRISDHMFQSRMGSFKTLRPKVGGKQIYTWRGVSLRVASDDRQPHEAGFEL